MAAASRRKGLLRRGRDGDATPEPADRADDLPPEEHASNEAWSGREGALGPIDEPLEALEALEADELPAEEDDEGGDEPAASGLRAGVRLGGGRDQTDGQQAADLGDLDVVDVVEVVRESAFRSEANDDIFEMDEPDSDEIRRDPTFRKLGFAGESAPPPPAGPVAMAPQAAQERRLPADIFSTPRPTVRSEAPPSAPPLRSAPRSDLPLPSSRPVRISRDEAAAGPPSRVAGAALNLLAVGGTGLLGIGALAAFSALLVAGASVWWAMTPTGDAPEPAPMVQPAPGEVPAPAPGEAGGAPDEGAPDGGAPDGGAPDGGAPDGGAPDGSGTPPKPKPRPKPVEAPPAPVPAPDPAPVPVAPAPAPVPAPTPTPVEDEDDKKKKSKKKK